MGFITQEFVPKTVFDKFGDESLRLFIDPRLISGINLIRNHFDAPITINNWHIGGEFQYRGFRPSYCTVGAEYSQHRFGRALDFNVHGVDPREVRDSLISNWSKFNKYLTTIEGVVTGWTHIDCRGVINQTANVPKIVSP